MRQQQQGVYCGACGAQDFGLGRACPSCSQVHGAQPGVRVSGFGMRLVAYILDGVLVFLTLLIGYVIWWLIVLKNGQTPGKQLVGIRAIKVDGSPSGWGWTFLREFVVKGMLFGGIASYVTFGLAWLIDYLWPLWDKDRQALHDKIVGTLVVEVPRNWARGAVPPNGYV